VSRETALGIQQPQESCALVEQERIHDPVATWENVAANRVERGG
jgi:hypothetical protein